MSSVENWYKAVLEHVPHGEDGRLVNLDGEELMTMINLLNKKGYAVCVTTGDIGDTFNIAWFHAGDINNIDYADYGNVVFTHIDYIDDYPKALDAEFADAETEGEE